MPSLGFRMDHVPIEPLALPPMRDSVHVRVVDVVELQIVDVHARAAASLLTAATFAVNNSDVTPVAGVRPTSRRSLARREGSEIGARAR